MRRALRAGGEPIDRAFLEPAERPRRIVLLLDVSGSMEPYARALVRFLHAAVVGRGRVEAFALGTRLTRITRELSSRDPDAAIAAAARRVVDWSGGTRLGEGLRVFNDTGACAAWRGARSSSSCPTAGTGATPTCSASRWPASAGRLQDRVGEPAEGVARLRAAGPGNGRGVAVR